MNLTFDIIDGIAVVELDNPPVNALCDEIRDGVVDLMPRLDGDPAVDAILFVGSGHTFCAGVDLKKTARRTEPFFLHAALDAMDRVSKPLLAAMQGVAMGGGLELALACHYRLAARHARFALPEVDVGIIPGACGTQRLPRLIPLARALDIAALGDVVDSNEALALGLVDAIADNRDFRAAALVWAGSLRRAPRRRTRDLPVRMSADAEAEFSRAATRAARERPGSIAPSKAAEAVRAACEQSFEHGVETERRLVTELKHSAEARALRHLFLAERIAGKLAAEPAPLDSLRLSGPLADRVRAEAKLLGVVPRADAGIDVYAMGTGQPAPSGIMTAVLPETNAGTVELVVPVGIDERGAAATVRLLKRLGRAVIICRGALMGDRLRAATRRHPHLPLATALANEGEQLLREGIAMTASDIDVFCTLSLGVPRSSGGPMFMRAQGEA